MNKKEFIGKITLIIILATMIFIGISVSHSVISSYNETLSFEHNGKEYNINVGELASGKNVNIGGYPYYIITVDGNSKITIDFCKERLYASEERVSYSISSSSKEFLKIEVKENGETTTVKKDTISLWIHKNDVQTRFIASNHDIFKKDTTNINFK